MADVIETGGRDREVVVEREPRSAAGWIIAAIVLLVLLLLLFGGSLFRGATNDNTQTDTSPLPTVELDSGSDTGSGTDTGAGTGTAQ